MQKDLFGGIVAATVLPNQTESKSDFLQRYRFNLRLDQVIIAALLLLVAYVLVFSFGVESGKRYAMAEIKAERAMRERMARELGEKIFANNNQAVQTPAAAPVDAKTPVVKTLAEVKTPSPAELQSAVVKAVKTKISPELPAAGSSGKYAIQTVTFTSKAAAEKFLQKLSAKGYQGKILPRGKFQQVLVTGFESKEKALKIMGRLKNEGLAPKDAYIRPLAA